GCGRRATGPSSRTASTRSRHGRSMTASAPGPLVALTAGEPAGIGPDLCALLSGATLPGRIVIVGDGAVIRDRARLRGLPWDVPAYAGRDAAPKLSVLSIPTSAPVRAGRLDAANGRHVVQLLDR